MGVFDGLKVLELGAGAAGPVVTRYFGEQGAVVVRVESSRRPDFLRLADCSWDRSQPDRLLPSADPYTMSHAAARKFPPARSAAGVLNGRGHRSRPKG